MGSLWRCGFAAAAILLLVGCQDDKPFELVNGYGVDVEFLQFNVVPDGVLSEATLGDPIRLRPDERRTSRISTRVDMVEIYTLDLDLAQAAPAADLERVVIVLDAGCSVLTAAADE